MEELKKSIVPLVQEELERANKKFPQFASAHEGFAVLLEEVEEAQEDLRLIYDVLTELWEGIKIDNFDKEELVKIYKLAIELVAESIQCAAVAQKFLNMEGKQYE